VMQDVETSTQVYPLFRAKIQAIAPAVAQASPAIPLGRHDAIAPSRKLGDCDGAIQSD